jgi:hypothetical protein
VSNRRAKILTFVLLFWASNRVALSAKVAIPKRAKNLISERLLPAYRIGSPLLLAGSIHDLLPELTDDQVKAINAHLDEQDFPPLEDMFAESLLGMANQGNTSAFAELKSRELAIVIPRIRAMIAATLESAKTHPVFKTPLASPDNLPEFERLFWEVHVFEQRLQSAVKLQQLGLLLHDQALNVFRKATPGQQDVLMSDFGLAGYQLEVTQQQLLERKLELRLRRLRLANSILQRSGGQRGLFEAARAVDLDGQLLTSYFASLVNTAGAEGPAGLNDVAAIKTLIADSTDKAGELIEKSRLFYDGLHWWLRGRYGKSTDGGGLLKPRMAYDSPQLMFQLYMPSELYSPPGTRQGDVQPNPQRRHQAVWSFEPNRLATVRPPGSQTGTIVTQQFY